MYFMRLLTTNTENKVVVKLGVCSFNKSGDLEATVNRSWEEFYQAKLVDHEISGFAIYSKTPRHPKLCYTYLLPEYKELERDILKVNTV